MSEQGPGKNGSRWVFGYGSLIWKPGFEFVRAEAVRVHGVHRSLCIYSTRYRGTKSQPGLVFGLMKGGSCAGMGFEIAPENWEQVRGYLRGRELISHVYREVERNMRFADGTTATALTFVVDEAHPQFAGRLSVDKQLDLVSRASGSAGRNRDYVLNTVDHLKEMGFADKHLIDLARRLWDKTDAVERADAGQAASRRAT